MSPCRESIACAGVLQKLEVKDEGGVGAYLALTLLAVAQLLRYINAPLVADVHVLQGGGEALHRVAHQEVGGTTKVGAEDAGGVVVEP